MGQVRIDGADAVAALETLVPGDVAALAPGRTRYSMFTLDDGGIIDDLMVTRAGKGDDKDHLVMVVNASCKEQDLSHLQANLNNRCEVEPLFDRALMALQGPRAAAVMQKIAPDSAAMKFMTGRPLNVGGMQCFVTRSGYTGEDGFEISVPGGEADNLARKLLGDMEVKPIGLGARDSLRLEAGLCLYGNDITDSTTPVEAALTWAIQKRRREQGGFPGAGIVQRQLSEGPPRKRVGILPDGKAPARAHTEIANEHGEVVGEVTSGGFGPTVGGPVAMGYVRADLAAIGTRLQLMVRGKALPAKVAAMPFAPHRYHR
jgi:aminomethyltransferase